MEEPTLNWNHYGRGVVLPVVYDTAWVARIPEFNNLNQPAFPQSLNWLRTHQLVDGSWGSYPMSMHAHSQLLNTLASILALKQWQDPQDEARIELALASLDKFAQILDSTTANPVGFELLFPALIEECQQLNLFLPVSVEKLYLACQPDRLKKQKAIDQFHQMHGYQALSWWFSLEMLGSEILKNKKNDFPLSEILLFPEGSVAASPSATAYLITALRYRGQDNLKAIHYLKKVMYKDGSMPQVAPIDEFELAFSANYLLEAGALLQHFPFSSLLKKLKTKWVQRQSKGIGYSSDFFIDPDDTAVALRVLKLTHPHDQSLSSDLLLKYFNGHHIENFTGESSPSLSANIHALHALRLFEKDPQAINAIQNILNFLKQIPTNFLMDKWHSSAIYPTSRALLALKGVDDPLAERYANWLLDQQHLDGGWGMQKFSSAEETAFASLALTQWADSHSHVYDALNAAQSYLNTNPLRNVPLWVGKVCYCPKNVVEALIFSARYALKKTLEADRKVFYFNSKATSENSHKVLCIADKYVTDSVLLENIQQKVQEWAIDLQLYPKEAKIFKSKFVICSAQAIQGNLAQNILYSKLGLIILTLDDVLDESWSFLPPHHVIKKILYSFIDSIGSSKNFSDSTIFENFPKGLALHHAFSHFFQELLNLELNLQYFIKSLKIFFKFLLKELTYRQTPKFMDLEEYFYFRVIAGGMDVANELAFLLHDITLSKKIRKNYHFKFSKYHAYRALILMNDILSFNKEKDHEINHYFLLEPLKQFSLEDKINYAIQQYNQCIQLFELERRLLLSEVSGEEKIMLEKATQLIANQVQAHLDWGVETARYQKEGDILARNYL